jgi:mRNA interferase MazF
VKRGHLYRVYKGSVQDPKKYRVFVVVSRQVLIDSQFTTVICAPVTLVTLDRQQLERGKGVTDVKKPA